MTTHTESRLGPKMRCLTCEGQPWIVPDENQDAEQASIEHLILHKDDVGGPHEIGVRYILIQEEVEDSMMSKVDPQDEQLETAED